jgi:hypothetical protein
VKQQRQHHNVILARGRDRFAHYNIQEKPTLTTKEGITAQLEYEQNLNRDY